MRMFKASMRKKELYFSAISDAMKDFDKGKPQDRKRSNEVINKPEIPSHWKQHFKGKGK